MSRRGAAEALAAVITLAPGFTADSTGAVAIGDHRVLNTGVDRAAVIGNDNYRSAPDEFGNEWGMVWNFAVEVYIRHNNDVVQAREDSDIYIQSILDTLKNHRNLDGAVWDCTFIEGRLEDEAIKVGRTPFLLEVLTIAAKE